MSKYPAESCRNCSFANWVWSNRAYPDGYRRIIVQHMTLCTAGVDLKPLAGTTEKIDARTPYTQCPAWSFHNDPALAPR